MPLNCFLGMRHKKVVLLKQMLNEVLNLDPPLVINDRYDAETKAAVMQFEFKSLIRPANGKMDDITWVSLGQVLPPGRLQQLLTAANNDPDLFELFGLVPNSGIIQFNIYPPFNKEDLETVQKGLELAKKRVNDKIQSDTALQSYGIPSVMGLLNGVSLDGANPNTFDGRVSVCLARDRKHHNLMTVRKYFVDYREIVGAKVTLGGGPHGANVMFIGYYYFTPIAAGNIEMQRAFILMHESVHLVGNKEDEVFGGNPQLSELLIQTFFYGEQINFGGIE
jgi:hypothetical protein